MISSLRLKFGRGPGVSPGEIPATPVTVFVGPNNSGKSQVLLEIEQYCRTGQTNANALILDKLSFVGLAPDAVGQEIGRLRQPPQGGQSILADHMLVGGRHGLYQVRPDELARTITNPSINVQAFCQWFLTHQTLMLDGRSRIDLVKPQTAGDLAQPSQSSFQVLFRDDPKRHEVRRIVHEAFGSYFVIDPTNLGHLRVRLSSRPPDDDREERGIHAEAVQFHAAAQLIDQASDGVKAFTGIISEVIAGDPRIILIDEPEAFLHPSLATKLGYEVSRAARATDKRVFISTHSPMFVMGCIQSGAPVNIIRLTYRGGVATTRVLPSDDLLQLMRHPLLRSTGVLSGLFYEFVVVTESDADRAFYQEINERLLQFRPEWGIPNCLFINAQNKQTVHTIIRPLRQLGIPIAAVVDVDVLKEGGTNWTGLLSSANVPQIDVNSLATLRAAVEGAMKATGRDMKRDGGIAILPGSEREAAENLLDRLSEYGVFVVPGGELESWMSPLGAASHGPAWLIEVFEKMGVAPEDPGYVKPQDGDVWHFLSRIKGWLTNAGRKGIPT